MRPGAAGARYCLLWQTICNFQGSVATHSVPQWWAAASACRLYCLCCVLVLAIIACHLRHAACLTLLQLLWALHSQPVCEAHLSGGPEWYPPKATQQRSCRWVSTPAHTHAKSTQVDWRRAEAAFWQIVEEGEDPVEVLYGADLDTAQLGSGFPRAGGAMAADAYADAPWNLNNIPGLEGGVCRAFIALADACDNGRPLCQAHRMHCAESPWVTSQMPVTIGLVLAGNMDSKPGGGRLWRE